MLNRVRFAALTSFCVIGFFSFEARSQQVGVSTPLVGVNDSFYERIGIDWGVRGRNWFFSRGGDGGIPQFGGYDPSAEARFGFGFRGSGVSGFFNLAAGQGSRRSIISSTPSLVLPNGGIGAVQDISVRPFVTGFTPVVGARAVSPVRERLERLKKEAATARSPSRPANAPLLLRAAGAKPSAAKRQDNTQRPRGSSTAERGDISLAEIRRVQTDAAGDAKDNLGELIREARLAEARGLFGAARIRYQRAAEKASGKQKQALLRKLESLADK